MPRPLRKISASGFYHVILRGNGKRILFETDADRRKFLSILKRYGEKYEIEYHAWCLMDNHVHLLIRDNGHVLSKAMHDIALVFAQHYNNVNDHVGTVFQGRFSSFPLETERYLLAVLRYIHNNPVRAGISSGLDYMWSSFDDYMRGATFTSTEFFLEMLGGPDGFRAFCSCYDESEMKEIDRKTTGRIPDSEALELAKQILGLKSPIVIESLEKSERDRRIRELLDAGLSTRQIGRFTGLGRNVVARISAKASQRTRPFDSPRTQKRVKGPGPLTHPARKSESKDPTLCQKPQEEKPGKGPDPLPETAGRKTWQRTRPFARKTTLRPVRAAADLV